MTRRTIIFNLIFVFAITQKMMAQDSLRSFVIPKSLDSIKTALDTSIFVMRFENIETPCICIDSTDRRHGNPLRKNTNYRIRLAKKNVIDRGDRCLNQYCARYMRLNIDCVGTDSLKLSGKVQFSYGYPASHIIQFLSMANKNADKTNSFFDSLFTNTGSFNIYPELDKYRIRIKMDDDGPYNSNDIIFGYLEITIDPFTSQSVHCFYFDKMSLQKGDDNNAISLRFTSTSFLLETQYYARQLFEVLKHNNSADLRMKANAIWTKHFFSDPECPHCHFIYDMAETMRLNNSSFPSNTRPVPAH